MTRHDGPFGPPRPSSYHEAGPRPGARSTISAHDRYRSHPDGSRACNPYPEATAALRGPCSATSIPSSSHLLDETCDRLRQVWGTANALTLPVSGTGSAGMEAAFVNTVGPGDVVVVGVNGLFGERMCDVAGRCGAEVVRVDAPWGRPLDPAAAQPIPTPK